VVFEVYVVEEVATTTPMHTALVKAALALTDADDVAVTI
jgi:hypothetical protein